LVSDQLKLAFAHLRYFLGGDRPSQTVNLALSLKKLAKKEKPSGISITLKTPTYSEQFKHS